MEPPLSRFNSQELQRLLLRILSLYLLQQRVLLLSIHLPSLQLQQHHLPLPLPLHRLLLLLPLLLW